MAELSSTYTLPLKRKFILPFRLILVNKPLQGMAPTECPLSACLLACLLLEPPLDSLECYRNSFKAILSALLHKVNGHTGGAKKGKKSDICQKGDSCIVEMPLTHSYYGYYVINIQIKRH